MALNIKYWLKEIKNDETTYLFQFLKRHENTSKVLISWFMKNLFLGITYNKYSLDNTPESVIKKKSVDILPKNDLKNTLFLDLDETLIHSCDSGKNKTTFKYKGNEKEIKFNIRPNCKEFLEKMSELFDIYISTASNEEYAIAIIDFIDPNSEFIDGILSRNCCINTMNNYYIKDLRTINNRSLKNIVLIDNNPYCFGKTYENCVPIIDFYNNDQDNELYELENYLKKLARCEDVRETNKKNYLI